jgi:hypothetical protein
MPSVLLCVVQISSRPAGRRHGVTGESAPHSTAAFRHRPPQGRFQLVAVATTSKWPYT